MDNWKLIQERDEAEGRADFWKYVAIALFVLMVLAGLFRLLPAHPEGNINWP